MGVSANENQPHLEIEGGRWNDGPNIFMCMDKFGFSANKENDEPRRQINAEVVGGIGEWVGILTSEIALVGGKLCGSAGVGIRHWIFMGKYRYLK